MYNLVQLGKDVTASDAFVRLDQAQPRASKAYRIDCMPSQTCGSKNESVVERLVGMIVCDEWMWCGVDAVCV